MSITLTSINADIYSQEFQQNLYSYFPQLRTEGNVVFLPKSNCWIVLGYNEAKEVLDNAAIYSSEHLNSVDSVLLGADSKKHLTNKRTITQHITTFQPTGPAQLKDYALKVYAHLSQELENKQNYNLVTELINPFTFYVALRAVGMNHLPLALDIFDPTVPHVEKLERINILYNHWDQLLPLIHENIEDKHAGKEIQEVLSALNINRDYSQEELERFVKLLILAGTETTASFIASSVYFALTNENISERLKNNLEGASSFFTEVLRINSPAQFTFRYTKSSVQLAGKEIPAGSLVAVSVGAANRDPEIFDEPDSFQLNRKGKNISFGSGVHRCIGEHLATYLAKLFMAEFILNTDKLEIIAPVENFNTLFTFKISNIPVQVKA